jgi:uncharacterized protein YjbJ (UPF0337 family)
MGWLDKLLGRGKRTAGEATGSPTVREEGVHQEAAARASERAEAHEEMAASERETAAEHRAEEDQL